MLSTDSGFSENVYKAAASERLNEARGLLNATPPSYALAAYVSGVAVECILLAYLMRAGETNDGKHNVNLLAQRSGFFNKMTTSEKERLGSALGEVFSRWQNNHRYRDETALRAFVVRYRFFAVEQGSKRTTRRDALAHNADVLFEAASQIITTGETRWNSSSET